MSDNTPVKFITVWPWHHDEPALSISFKVNANSNKLLKKFEPHSSFRFQYWLLTMATFFEIAVYWKKKNLIWEGKNNFHFLCYGHETGFLTKHIFKQIRSRPTLFRNIIFPIWAKYVWWNDRYRCSSLRKGPADKTYLLFLRSVDSTALCTITAANTGYPVLPSFNLDKSKAIKI